MIVQITRPIVAMLAVKIDAKPRALQQPPAPNVELPRGVERLVGWAHLEDHRIAINIKRHEIDREPWLIVSAAFLIFQYAMALDVIVKRGIPFVHDQHCRVGLSIAWPIQDAQTQAGHGSNPSIWMNVLNS